MASLLPCRRCTSDQRELRRASLACFIRPKDRGGGRGMGCQLVGVSRGRNQDKDRGGARACGCWGDGGCMSVWQMQMHVPVQIHTHPLALGHSFIRHPTPPTCTATKALDSVSAILCSPSSSASVAPSFVLCARVSVSVPLCFPLSLVLSLSVSLTLSSSRCFPPSQTHTMRTYPTPHTQRPSSPHLHRHRGPCQRVSHPLQLLLEGAILQRHLSSTPPERLGCSALRQQRRHPG